MVLDIESEVDCPDCLHPLSEHSPGCQHKLGDGDICCCDYWVERSAELEEEMRYRWRELDGPLDYKMNGVH